MLLTKAESTRYQNLMAFQAPWLEEKLRKLGVVQTHEDFNHIFTEFKRFAWLAVTSGRNFPMTSKVVDDLWHQFILFTAQYANFCQTYLGEFLHHRPETSHTPLDGTHSSAFFDTYRERFGEIAALWLRDDNANDPCDGCSRSDGGCSRSSACQS